MIACLRSSRFTLRGGGAPVFLDLRRLQDINAIATGHHTKQFVVSRRFTLDGKHIVTNKRFDTLPEARRYWCEVAMKLEDEGRQRLDFHIAGFHEED